MTRPLRTRQPWYLTTFGVLRVAGEELQHPHLDGKPLGHDRRRNLHPLSDFFSKPSRQLSKNLRFPRPPHRCSLPLLTSTSNKPEVKLGRSHQVAGEQHHGDVVGPSLVAVPLRHIVERRLGAGVLASAQRTAVLADLVFDVAAHVRIGARL